MNNLRIFLFAVLALSFTGCVEIIDDLTLNLDGSGTLKYNINLSSSKVKINSVLALDSLDGKKVPSLYDIKQKIRGIEEKLESASGMSNVTITADYDNFIFKLHCDFESLAQLQEAIKTIAVAENKGKSIPEFDHNWLLFSNQTLERSVPELTISKTKEIKDKDQKLLKTGSYTSITRFENEILKFDNEEAKLSADKKAIMLRSDPYSLMLNPNLLDNTIYLNKSE